MRSQFFRDTVISGAILLILALLEISDIANAGTSVIQTQLQPMMVAHTRLFHSLTAPYRQGLAAWNAAERVQDLELRTAEYQAQLSELDQLRQENQALRQLLENSDRKLEQRIIASPLVSYALPSVAAGSVQGVREGGLVLVKNTLVGRISKVGDNQSEVTLLSSPNSNPIISQTELGSKGIVVGDGRNVLLTEVPLDQDLTVGERVVTVGQEGVGRGIFVGTIIRVETRETAPVKTAVLEQFVSFYDVTIVEIL